jgi:hypothetical protein
LAPNAIKKAPSKLYGTLSDRNYAFSKMSFVAFLVGIVRLIASPTLSKG